MRQCWLRWSGSQYGADWEWQCSSSSCGHFLCTYLPTSSHLVRKRKSIPSTQHWRLYEKDFFSAWIVLGFIWAITASCVIIIMPLWESRAGNKLLISLFITQSRVLKLLLWYAGLYLVLLGLLTHLRIIKDKNSSSGDLFDNNTTEAPKEKIVDTPQEKYGSTTA